MKILYLIIFNFLIICNVCASDIHKVDIYDITDGDTIKVVYNGEILKIRLLEIDCFETSKNKRAKWQSQTYNKNLDEVINTGKQSKNILKKIINDNIDNIYVELKNKDIYRRWLAYVYVGNKNININKYMLNEGKCLQYKPMRRNKK